MTSHRSTTPEGRINTFRVPPDPLFERVLTLLVSYPGLRVEHIAWALDMGTPRVLHALTLLYERGFVVPDNHYYFGGWAASGAWHPDWEPTIDGLPADWPRDHAALALSPEMASRLGYLSQHQPRLGGF